MTNQYQAMRVIQNVSLYQEEESIPGHFWWDNATENYEN